MFNNLYNELTSIKDIATLQSVRNAINEAFDSRMSVLTMCNEAKDLSEHSFYFIKEAFESVSPKLYHMGKEGNKLLAKYISTIKESKNLSAMHSLCENIRKVGKDSDISYFIANVSSTDWGVNKNQLAEDCKKLGKVLAEAYIMVKGDVTLPTIDNKLDSAIEYIAENKRTQKNIAEYSNAVKIIRENINKNETPDSTFIKENFEDTAKKLIKEFNSKYAELSDVEKSVIKELSENKDMEAVFHKYKNICSTKILEAKSDFEKQNDQESVKRLDDIHVKVLNKKFIKESVGEDICTLIEISKLF